MPESTTDQNTNSWMYVAIAILAIFAVAIYFIWQQSSSPIDATAQSPTAKTPTAQSSPKPSAPNTEDLLKAIDTSQMSKEQIAALEKAVIRKSDTAEKEALGSTVDTSLLETDEEVLKEQLLRASPDDITVSDASHIAKNATEMPTRIAAINAIAVHDTPESDQALRDVFDEANSEPVQKEVLRNIQSQSLNSSESLWMSEKMHSSEIHNRVKYEIAKKLVITGMIENPGNTEFYESLVSSMPSDVQNYFDQHLVRLQGSGR